MHLVVNKRQKEILTILNVSGVVLLHCLNDHTHYTHIFQRPTYLVTNGNDFMNYMKTLIT